MVVAPRFWGLTRFGGHLPCRQERVKFDLTGPKQCNHQVLAGRVMARRSVDSAGALGNWATGGGPFPFLDGRAANWATGRGRIEAVSEGP
jgi:hypothetical protein